MPGLDHEVQVHAVARDFVAHHAELQRLFRAFAQDGDAHRGALGALQHVGHFAGGQVVGGLAVHGDDHVAWADAGAVRRRAHEGRDHDDLIIARAHRHAHAVILAALLFAQQGIGLGIEEVGVRIEHAQHAGNGAVVDGLVRVHWLGVVLLHDVVNLGEGAQAVAHIGIAAGSGRADLLPEQGSQEPTKNENENHQENEATRRTACHDANTLASDSPPAE